MNIKRKQSEFDHIKERKFGIEGTGVLAALVWEAECERGNATAQRTDQSWILQHVAHYAFGSFGFSCRHNSKRTL